MAHCIVGGTRNPGNLLKENEEREMLQIVCGYKLWYTTCLTVGVQPPARMLRWATMDDQHTPPSESTYLDAQQH